MRKTLVSIALAAAICVPGTAAFAGGPVIVEEEGQPEVIAESPRSGWIVPVIVGAIILCAIACGGGNDGGTTGGAEPEEPVDNEPPET